MIKIKKLSLSLPDVEIFLIYPSSALIEIEEASSTLSEEELFQAARIADAQLRSGYVARHLALRQLLSERVEIEPRSLEIVHRNGDKPRLKDDRYAFSLSSSQGYSVIALRSSGEIGVDIQVQVADFDFSTILADQYSPHEAEFVVSSENPIESFFRGWVRKEAIVKAFGWGVKAPWKEVVTLPEVGFAELIYERQRFDVLDLNVEPGFMAAVAYLL